MESENGSSRISFSARNLRRLRTFPKASIGYIHAVSGEHCGKSERDWRGAKLELGLELLLRMVIK